MAEIWTQVEAGMGRLLSYQIHQLRSSEELAACGSEIERAFAVALAVGIRLSGGAIWFARRPSATSKPSYFLEPQVQIGSYRVDFLLGFNSLADDLRQCVVVECDGHEWHERTKEQAARDKSRDRFLSGQVGRVLRFTGSEIFADADRCAREAAAVLQSFIPEEIA